MYKKRTSRAKKREREREYIESRVASIDCGVTVTDAHSPLSLGPQ